METIKRKNDIKPEEASHFYIAQKSLSKAKY